MSNLKTRIEHHQIYIYFAALILGTIAGMSSVTLSNILDHFATFFIAILMFSMFSQIPFSTIKKHFLPVKYIIALVISNFILIPILVYGLIHLFNITSLPILIGLYLV
ncbi:arsenic resistance protein, partial [Staphylococcus succinus]